MRPLFPILIIASLLCLGSSAAARMDGSAPVAATCTRALDGDSLVVRAGGRTIEVRLVGVDAPEHGQEWGEAAKAELARLCGPGNDVRLERDRELRDRYGRHLLWVWDGDVLLNERMVRFGLALPLHIPPNGTYRARIERARDHARQEKAGFWRQGGLRRTPRQWRRSAPR